jgi:hypothetical protein
MRMEKGRDVRNAVMVSSIESNCEAAFMSKRVEEGIAAGKSGFSGRCRCIYSIFYPTVTASGYERMDTSGEFIEGRLVANKIQLEYNICTSTDTGRLREHRFRALKRLY